MGILFFRVNQKCPFHVPYVLLRSDPTFCYVPSGPTVFCENRMLVESMFLQRVSDAAWKAKKS